MCDLLEEGLKFKSDDKTLDKTTCALIKLLIDAKRLNLNENDFSTQLNAFGFDDASIASCWKFLQQASLSNLINRSNNQRFRDLEWRLEARIASRSLHSIPPEPKILMKIHTDRENALQFREMIDGSCKNNSTRQEIVLEVDANNLVHIIEKLELIMLESKTPRVRSFLSAVQH